MMFARLRQPAPRRGFTLIEMMLYLGFIGVILTAIVMFASDFLATGAKSQAYAEVAWNSRFAASRVASEIREARSYEPGSSTFDTDTSTLVLRSSNPVDELVTIAVVDGALTITRGTGPAVPITSSQVEVTRFRVEDLSFGGRSRNFYILVDVTSTIDGAWQQAPTAEYETTERIRRLEGFSN